ncbi:MAG: prepilin-type N-terminal cleavage/methylation domain-containing protein [Nitrospirae bacterium]|nr:prepilin-type N-terminal cleavage/methylation domain-containing protein [Nitrospirota bacterium]MBF0540943.1 prepilin-type N-terminal cleavage/methylation domain-containing protein [Nitrospirota bacterium]
MNHRGFTLLEVLIAASILTISFLSIYTLINSNINLSNSIQNKAELLGAENELLYNLYPQNLAQTSSIPVKLDDYKNITYNIKILPSGVFDSKIYTVSLRNKGDELEFIFYK